MKTKQLFRLLTALSFLLATLPVQAVQAAPALSAEPADLLQFTSGGHALGFTADGMYAATGSHALHVDFAGANAVQPQVDSPAAADSKTAPLSRVTYVDLWDGITLTYTAGADSIYTTTYTLAPGAAPADIRLRYNAPLTLNVDGTLTIAFETGTMTESAPIAWQEILGQRVPVDVSFRVSGQEVSFTLGSYDPRYALTIDPSLIWNTFLGGSGEDIGNGIAVDGSGNVYVTGGSNTTWGCSGPACTVRAYTGDYDAFVAKLDPSGNLIWNTFLGTSGDDYGQGIAVDGSGNVYVVGGGNAIWGSPVRAYTSGTDAFVVKLNSSGSLLWNTFLGGSGSDGGSGIAVDGSGNVYVVGNSDETWGIPVRAHAVGTDAYAAELDSSGGLTWNTFLGGSDYGYDIGNGIAVDGSGNVYVTGTSDATWGCSGPACTVRAYTGDYDAFVAKLDPSGNLIWNTFLGESGEDYGYGIAVDGSGNVYVAGYSGATWGSPVWAFAGGYDDAFAAKLDSSTGVLTWNTFLGGFYTDYGYDIAVDGGGNVYVVGNSDDTWCSPLRAFTGSSDAFAAKLTSAGNLTWHTFLGGSGSDGGSGIAVDGSGNVYVVGNSDETWGIPVRAHAVGTDAYAAKLDLDPPTVVSSLRTSMNPTGADRVDFTVTFSEAVTGVDTGDFTLNTTGVTDAWITGVNGSGTTYTVTVNTGTGSGTLRMNVTDNDSIVDLTGNPLGGPGAGNGNYTGGETYTIDRRIIRWFIGLSGGTDPAQVAIEQTVADDFNALHPDILLVLEVVDPSVASDTLLAEIAAGNGPDIIGPVSWSDANAFPGQSLDLAPLIASTGFDTTQFNPALADMYNTDEGQVALPFSVFPSAIFYNPALFTAAGLNHPPAHYDDPYILNSVPVNWTWETLGTVAKLLTKDSTGKNATQVGFDGTHIVQYGFSYGWESHPNQWGSFWHAGTLVQGTPGSYTAGIPAAWNAAWQWIYDGIWGTQPFIPNGTVSNSADFDNGNVFASGKIAMLENPSWYICCVGDLVSAGGTFQLGAMPSYDGEVAGRVDADTFRIWKDTNHPDEAFTALTYLVTTGVDKLIVGTETEQAAFGGFGVVPALTAKQDDYLDLKAAQFPFVTQDSWDILMTGLDYPDVPVADGYMPHFDEAWDRLTTFGNLVSNDGTISLDREVACLQTDLTAIFNGQAVPGCLYISGNAGVGGATLSYDYNGAKSTIATGLGYYWLVVPTNWTGTVTPSKPGYTFTPTNRTYTSITTDRTSQNYTAQTNPLPGAFAKLGPASGLYGSPTGVTLSWEASSGATGYEYCYDTSDNGACNSAWTDAGTDTSAEISGLNLSSTYYWQVRSTNLAGETYANGGTGTGTWWSLRTGVFADVPVAGKEWMRNWIEGFYSAGITTGCGASPRIYCPEREVTRAEMAVFLLRAKHGAAYVPPAATGVFGDVPFAGKEWMQPWIEQFYREGITTGCGAGPIYCPERNVTRAEMAVFVLRAKHGAAYVPPAATGVFLDVPVAGKEWMQPWIEQFYREGITTGCGAGPLYCPERNVTRAEMAVFIGRAYSIPLAP